MSYWVEGTEELRGGWHWLGEAFSFSTTMGLHRKKDYERLTSQEAQLHRRIFWSFYIRDRVLGLVLGRPMRLREGEYDTPMLTISDFQVDKLDTEHANNSPDEPVMTEEEQISVAEMSISMAKLCVLIEPILSLHFSVLPSDESPEYACHRKNRTIPLHFFRSSSMNVSLRDVERCDQGLQTWLSHLPPPCQYQHPTEQGARSNLPTIHAASLQLAFSAIVSALHRPLLHAKSLQWFPEYRLLSQRRFHDAADNISRVCRDLSSHGLDRYMMAIALMIQLPTIITHDAFGHQRDNTRKKA